MASFEVGFVSIGVGLKRRRRNSDRTLVHRHLRILTEVLTEPIADGEGSFATVGKVDQSEEYIVLLNIMEQGEQFNLLQEKSAPV